MQAAPPHDAGPKSTDDMDVEMGEAQTTNLQHTQQAAADPAAKENSADNARHRVPASPVRKAIPSYMRSTASSARARGIARRGWWPDTPRAAPFLILVSTSFPSTR